MSSAQARQHEVSSAAPDSRRAATKIESALTSHAHTYAATSEFVVAVGVVANKELDSCAIDTTLIVENTRTALNFSVALTHLSIPQITNNPFRGVDKFDERAHAVGCHLFANATLR